MSVAMYTVIIPAYNVEGWVGDAIDSVVESFLQSPVNSVEIICVNDGSTDNTLSIIQDRKEKILKLGEPIECKILVQANGGVSKARNSALDVARGDWVLFLDADDLLGKHTFCIFNSILVQGRDRVDAIQFKSQKFEHKDSLNNREARCTVDRMCQRDASHYLASEVVDTPLARYAFRRSCIKDIRFKPLSMGEDRLFLAEALQHINNIITIGNTLYNYRLRQGSALRSPYTLKKASDELKYVLINAKVLNDSNKKIDKKAYRRIGLLLLEKCAVNILKIPSRIEQKQAIKLWIQAVKTVDTTHFTSYTRFSLLMCRWFGYLGGVVFGVIPYYMKAVGLRRK